MSDAQSMDRYAAVSGLGSKTARWGWLRVAHVQNLSELFFCHLGRGIPPAVSQGFMCFTDLTQLRGYWKTGTLGFSTEEA